MPADRRICRSEFLIQTFRKLVTVTSLLLYIENLNQNVTLRYPISSNIGAVRAGFLWRWSVVVECGRAVWRQSVVLECGG